MAMSRDKMPEEQGLRSASMLSSRAQTKARIGQLGLIAVGGLFVLVVLIMRQPRLLPVGAPGHTPAATLELTAPTELASYDLPGPVYDIAPDQSGNALWFAYMASGQADFLYRFDIQDGTFARWPLPPTDHNGFLERVVVAPDGSVWLSEDYQIIRFDPTSETMDSLPLAEDDPDARTDALTDSPTPGTWPAAITFDSNGQALVARHNVASLLRLDASLHVVDRVALPPGYDNLGDVIDEKGILFLAPYSGAGPVAITDEDGQLIAETTFPANRLSGDAAGVLAVGPSGAAWISPEAAIRPFGVEAGSPFDRGYSNGDGTSVLYLGSAGILERHGADGSVLASMEFERTPIQVDDGNGKVMTVSKMHRLSALVVESGGDVWYVDQSAPALVHIRL
jgi:streptogramin lyase